VPTAHGLLLVVYFWSSGIKTIPEWGKIMKWGDIMKRDKMDIYLTILTILLPIVAFMFVFYGEHKGALADIMDLQTDKTEMCVKLDKIAEKLNQIDGKLSILLKERN